MAMVTLTALERCVMLSFFIAWRHWRRGGREVGQAMMSDVHLQAADNGDTDRKLRGFRDTVPTVVEFRLVGTFTRDTNTTR